MGFWVVGSIPAIHNNNKLFRFSPYVELEKYSPRYAQEMTRLGY